MADETIDTNIEQLEAELQRKYSELSKIKIQEQDRRAELLTHYREIVRTTVTEEFGARLEAAKAEVGVAEEAARWERDRLARLGVGAKIPIGTRVVEWRSDFGGRWKPTGKIGVYELITSDSKHPKNGIAARVGTPVIRCLKRDGTPGSKYEKSYSPFSKEPLPYGWFLEGVDPNKTTRRRTKQTAVKDK